MAGPLLIFLFDFGLDFLQVKTVNRIADFNVIEILYADAAFIPGLDFFGIIFKST